MALSARKSSISSSSSSSSSSYSPSSRINPDLFHAWTEKSMYQSTYNQFHDMKRPEPKVSVIPGYAGYIPKEKAEGKYAKTMPSLAKECFGDPELGKDKFHLSTTGLMKKPEVFRDESIAASTYKFGAETMQKPHPAINAKEWKTQYDDSYRNPQTITPPTYRPDVTQETNKNPVTKQSGFATNYYTCDGKNTLLEPYNRSEDVLRRNLTEYRIRYDFEPPFHPNPVIFHLRKLDQFRNPLNIN